MSNNDFLKETVISNFISLNSTGLLNLESNGTFKTNGPPSIIMTPEEISKKNLNSVNSNTFICNQNEEKIENFENYNTYKILNNNNNIIIYLILLFLLILLILLIFLIIKKKRFKIIN
jgi:membrane-associated HD superfamily phosphohydrolase